MVDPNLNHNTTEQHLCDYLTVCGDIFEFRLSRLARLLSTFAPQQAKRPLVTWWSFAQFNFVKAKTTKNQMTVWPILKFCRSLTHWGTKAIVRLALLLQSSQEFQRNTASTLAVSNHLTRFLPLLSLPQPGFINSLKFSSSGQFLVAGVGQEHR